MFKNSIFATTTLFLSIAAQDKKTINRQSLNLFKMKIVIDRKQEEEIIKSTLNNQSSLSTFKPLHVAICNVCLRIAKLKKSNIPIKQLPAIQSGFNSDLITGEQFFQEVCHEPLYNNLSKNQINTAIEILSQNIDSFSQQERFTNIHTLPTEVKLKQLPENIAALSEHRKQKDDIKKQTDLQKKDTCTSLEFFKRTSGIIGMRVKFNNFYALDANSYYKKHCAAGMYNNLSDSVLQQHIKDLSEQKT